MLWVGERKLQQRLQNIPGIFDYCTLQCTINHESHYYQQEVQYDKYGGGWEEKQVKLA